MPAFIVTYDLNNETRRPPIVQTIKDYGSWARLSEPSYAISTWKSADQVKSDLRPMIDSNDQLYVIPLRQPYSGWGPQDVNQWLTDNLSW